MRESRSFDNKSLRLVYGKQENFPDIARDCVAFANVNGGHIHIGVEDGQELPPDGQIVPEGLDEKIARRIHELTTNVAVRPTIVKAKNDAEYIDLHILPSRTSVACTNRGEYLYRDEDQTKAVPPDELSRLFEDKPAFNWETKVVTNGFALTSRNWWKLALCLLMVRAKERSIRSTPNSLMLCRLMCLPH